MSIYAWYRQYQKYGVAGLMSSKRQIKRKNIDFNTKSIPAHDISELQEQIKQLQMEVDVLKEALNLLKKDPGISVTELKNREKAVVIDAMKNRYPLPNLLRLLNMAKSSYYYHETAIKQPDKYSHIRKKMIELFNENRKCYGYRRIHQELKRLGITISEKIVRDIRYSPLSKCKFSERLTDRVLSLSVILKIPDTCQFSYFLSMLKLRSRLRLSNAALHKSIGCMSNTGSDLFMIFTLFFPKTLQISAPLLRFQQHRKPSCPHPDKCISCLSVQSQQPFPCARLSQRFNRE